MAQNPRIARFDRKITVQRRSDGTISGGVKRGDFADQFTLWGRVVHNTGTQRLDGGMAVDSMPAEILVRDGENARTITTEDRVKIVLPNETNEYFRIDTVVPADRNFRFVRLRCSKWQNL